MGWDARERVVWWVLVHSGGGRSPGSLCFVVVYILVHNELGGEVGCQGACCVVGTCTQ